MNRRGFLSASGATALVAPVYTTRVGRSRSDRLSGASLAGKRRRLPALEILH